MAFYIQPENAAWQDRYIYEVFKINTGEKEVTLHREQSSLLKQLIEGRSIAESLGLDLWQVMGSFTFGGA